MQDFVLPDAFGHVTGVDDHAVGVRLIEARLTDRLEHAPRAVGVLEAERGRLGRARLLNRIRQRLHDGREIIGVHELERVPPEQLARAVAEQPLHRRRDVPENTVIAENGDNVRRVFRQRAEVLFAAAQRFFHPRALERGREHVGERLHEQHIGPAELARLGAIGSEHSPGTLATLYDDTDAADDVVRLEMWRDGEADVGGKIGDDDGTGGLERVAGERARLGRDQGVPHAALVPTFAGTYQQAAMRGLQLEDFAELDVETAGDELRRGIEQVGAGDPGQRLLSEERDSFLLTRGRAQLLLSAARFLNAQPAKPLRLQPRSGPGGKGLKLDAIRLRAREAGHGSRRP